jgi:acylphosphatase
MSRQRMTVFYSGRVQGVGFRYTVKSITPGFEITGTVRNLGDGRVEMTAEGERGELDAFRKAVRESGLGRLIQREEEAFGPATGEIRGFDLVR